MSWQREYGFEYSLVLTAKWYSDHIRWYENLKR